jgi:hypothetical protein
MHNDFFEPYRGRILLDNSLSGDLLGVLHKAVNTCKEMEKLTKGNKAVATFALIYRSLCLDLVDIEQSNKTAEILNPLTKLPTKPKNNTLAKARSLAKTVYPKMLKLFEHVPKTEKLQLLTNIKELFSFMELLRHQTDKHHRKHLDSWFVIYAFTLLADNITLALSESV